MLCERAQDQHQRYRPLAISFLSMESAYVVTGGRAGIGRAIAERLARDGRVVVLDLDTPD
jgi:hypothetical protein